MNVDCDTGLWSRITQRLRGKVRIANHRSGYISFPNDEECDASPGGTSRKNPNFLNPNDGMRPVHTMSKEEIQREKRRIWKNVFVISLSWMFLFTAYNAVANLQSSINSDEGLGTTTLATGSLALIVACMFVPTCMIKALKCKWTVVVSQLSVAVFIGAQFYPSFYTLIPAAVVLGLGTAPMWSAKGTYLSQIGNRYAALSGEDSPEGTISRFFGFFFSAFQLSQVWGNLISSLVLSNESDSTADALNDRILDYCGVNFCTEDALSNVTNDGVASVLERPSEGEIRLLLAILLGFALLAVFLVILLVDPLSKFGESQRQGSSTGKSGWRLLVATFHQMRHCSQVLLIPLSFWSGFEQAFLTADFTEAFIACAWSVEHIGFVLICYGLIDALGSVTGSYIIKKTGRIPLFLFGAGLNLALIVTMLYFWRPDPARPVLFFVVAGLWGMSDSIWQTQIISYYGVVFAGCEEAAFSNFLLWEALGFTVGFAYSTSVCVYLKLYILIGILLTGITGYLVVEFRERQQKS